MKLWGGPGGSSQSKRATNCATSGFVLTVYEYKEGDAGKEFAKDIIIYGSWDCKEMLRVV